MRRNRIILIIAISIVLVTFSIDKFNAIIKPLIYAFYPVFSGLLFALVLKSPVKFFEQHFFLFVKNLMLRRVLALCIVFITFFGVLSFFLVLIVPDITKSLAILNSKLTNFEIPDFGNETSEWPFFNSLVEQLSSLSSTVIGKCSEIFLNMFEKLANVLKHLIKFIIGLGLGLLIIIHKESLLRQLFFLLRSLRNTLYAKKTLLLISSGGDRFSKFLIGQFLECIVFGILCYAALFITRMPFAPILAILLAVGNLIPIIGAYIAGGIGLLLVFTESPHLSLLFILIIIIVQQIEQWTTYPLIVGKYMQLNGFWILFGVVIGGGLFGFWGLLLCVPTLSFLHDVIVIFINKKQLLKLPPDS